MWSEASWLLALSDCVQWVCILNPQSRTVQLNRHLPVIDQNHHNLKQTHDPANGAFPASTDLSQALPDPWQ